MSSYISPISMNALSSLCKELNKNNLINPNDFERFQVKRGLRNSDGTGVMAGLTRVCSVEGYYILDGERLPKDGKLIYRGVDVNDIIEGCQKDDRFGFEETIWLLLFGTLPTEQQLLALCEVMAECRELPDEFIEDMIMKAPSADIMNKLARSVLALYSYDEDPDNTSTENVLRQSLQLISQMPSIMVYAYQVKRRAFYHQSMFIHPVNKHQSIAEFILSSMRPDRGFTHEEAMLLDLCLILHAEHGGGNNSTFATRVLTSSGTDTYSAIAAGLGSLKGPRHGGANIKVANMMKDIMENVEDTSNEAQIAEYLTKIIRKEAGDGSGLIYGMGHAVYTLSDPRAILLKERARKLATGSEYEKEFVALENVEKLTPEIMKQIKGENKIVSANVDMYSGLVYKMLGIPDDLFTPMFATARVAGWCAHRLEEINTCGRIIRPAYKSVSLPQKYVDLIDRLEFADCGPEVYRPIEERI